MISELPDRIDIPNEQAMLDFGAQLAAALKPPCIIYLQGDLGAGKTTLTRGILRAMGHEGPVRSPTYTLIESYEPKGQKVFHIDLYRLHDPEELEYIGIRDYFTDDVIGLIEWPERAEGHIPTADLVCDIEITGDSRIINLHV